MFVSVCLCKCVYIRLITYNVDAQTSSTHAQTPSRRGAEDAEGCVSRHCGRVAVLLFPRVLGALPGLRRREGHEINAPKCMLRSGEKKHG